MAKLTYVKPEKIWLKGHPVLNEKWVQEIIAEDPSILGLGDLILKDKERIQQGAGRLDLLLQESDGGTRYEVEIQLGKTDETHIIRTIEYWDIEKKRYPQYEHMAVIIAEDITSRFLNVISLFNGAIPLIAIQMNAIKVGEQVGLVFTTVLDQLKLGLEEEDEDFEPTDRAYWEKRAVKSTVEMADELLEILQSFDPELELKYNKFYIGLAKDGRPNNFAVFKPKKSWMTLEIRLQKDDALEETLDSAGIDVIDYRSRSRRYRLKLKKGEVKKHQEILKEMLHKSYEGQ